MAVLGCLAAGRPCALVDPGTNETIGVPGATLRPALKIVHAAMPPVVVDVPQIVLPVEAHPPGQMDGQAETTIQEAAFLISCGRDRGRWVERSEAAVLLDIGLYIETCHLNDGDRHHPLAPQSSADGLRAMLAALLTGGTLHLVDQCSPGSAELLSAMLHAATTVCSGPASALLSLARLPGARQSFRAMRLVRIDAGPLHWNDVTVLRTLLPDACHILYAYCQTETFTCIQQFVTTPPAGARDTVPVGFALPGFAVSVIDPSGAEVPDGEVGELVVAGAFTGDSVHTGQMVRRSGNGLYEFVQHSDLPVVPVTPGFDINRDPVLRDAVRAASQSVLGVLPCTDETFASAGGDSLKLLEFAVQLEHRLGRRLPMSLLALQMGPEEIAAALAAPSAAAGSALSLLAHELMLRFESRAAIASSGGPSAPVRSNRTVCCALPVPRRTG